jgi:hypothetical protein
MDRRLVAVSLAGAALVFATGCKDDLVLADARDCLGQPETCIGNVVQANVQSGPAGENPGGRFVYESGFGMGRARIDARATCLEVHGDTAIIGYTGTVTGYMVRVYKAGLARLRHLGPRDSRKDTFQVTGGDISETPVPGPTTCSSFPGPFPSTSGESVNEEGDVIVFDASVPPDGASAALGR